MYLKELLKLLALFYAKGIPNSFELSKVRMIGSLGNVRRNKIFVRISVKIRIMGSSNYQMVNVYIKFLDEITLEETCLFFYMIRNGFIFLLTHLI